LRGKYFHTGLDRYITATVDNFTSDFGIIARRLMNTPCGRVGKTGRGYEKRY